MLKIKDNVDLIEKLNISNNKEKQEQLEDYIENLKDLYDEMFEALNEERNYIHYRWLSDLPDVARKLKFKVWENPCKEIGGCALYGDKLEFKNGRIYVKAGVTAVKISAIAFLENMGADHISYIW